MTLSISPWRHVLHLLKSQGLPHTLDNAIQRKAAPLRSCSCCHSVCSPVQVARSTVSAGKCQLYQFVSTVVAGPRVQTHAVNSMQNSEQQFVDALQWLAVVCTEFQAAASFTQIQFSANVVCTEFQAAASFMQIQILSRRTRSWLASLICGISERCPVSIGEVSPSTTVQGEFQLPK